MELSWTVQWKNLKFKKYLAYKENQLENILIMRLKLNTLKAYYYLPPYITYTYYHLNVAYRFRLQHILQSGRYYYDSFKSMKSDVGLHTPEQVY